MPSLKCRPPVDMEKLPPHDQLENKLENNASKNRLKAKDGCGEKKERKKNPQSLVRRGNIREKKRTESKKKTVSLVQVLGMRSMVH